MRPKRFSSVTFFRTAQCRILETQACIRTKTVVELYDQKEHKIITKSIKGQICIQSIMNLALLVFPGTDLIVLLHNNKILYTSYDTFFL